MKKNEEYTAECCDVTRMGYGLVHIDGQSVFVSDLLPGEKALIRIIKASKNVNIGKVIKRYNDSDMRTSPLCPVAGRCGGCMLQHVKYEDQLKLKHSWMKHLLSQADPDIEVRPVLGMQDPWFYRNKAQFPVQVQDGKVKIGFYKAHSNDIVPCSQCRIQNPLINRFYAWLQENLTPRNAKNLRHVFVRTNNDQSQLQVVFIGRKKEDILPLAAAANEAFEQSISIVFNENLRNDNVILGERYSVLYGEDFIDQQSMENSIALHFKSFFQVNPDQTRVLYEEALKAADLNENMEVIDLYSGTGTIALAAAKHAGHVTGVEIVSEAVENARDNAKRNGIDNVDFVCEDATVFASQFAKSGRQAQVVIVDPPRKGLSGQGIADIVKIAPERIVYISCGPDSLARDLKAFGQQGYRTEYVQPVDMFAQTAGLENIALLKKVSR